MKDVFCPISNENCYSNCIMRLKSSDGEQLCKIDLILSGLIEALAKLGAKE